jgi:N-acetylglucosaminyldiphosphoundecaprenol N-acetyl-beta-D-mannosaminyltransferase
MACPEIIDNHVVDRHLHSLSAIRERYLMTGQNCTTIDGVVFDAVDEETAVSTITSRAADGYGGFVITPNASILRQLRCPEHTELAASADLVLADGMPIVWASRLTRQPLPERVCGSALIWSVSRSAAAEDLPVMLLGGTEGVAERAAATLAARFPGLRTSWHFPPMGFESDEGLVDEVVTAVHLSRARIVFVGLGFPKQERLVLQLRRQFPEVWFIGCGAALTFVAGDICRAPQWMQDRGVEWVHRLIKEPRRLARRYLLGDVPFTLALFVRMAWLRLVVAVSRPSRLPAAAQAAAARTGAARTGAPATAAVIPLRSIAVGSTTGRGSATVDLRTRRRPADRERVAS